MLNSSAFLSIVCLKIPRPNFSREALAVLLCPVLCVFLALPRAAPCGTERRASVL